jgi:putative DNA primase/helicase
MVRRAPPEDAAKDIARAKACWQRGAPVRHDDVVDRYLHHRGVGSDAYPTCLRTSPSEPYWNDGAVSRHQAMLALIRDPAGKAVSVHRTYLAGKDKADLPAPRSGLRSSEAPITTVTPIGAGMNRPATGR